MIYFILKYCFTNIENYFVKIKKSNKITKILKFPSPVSPPQQPPALRLAARHETPH